MRRVGSCRRTVTARFRSLQREHVADQRAAVEARSHILEHLERGVQVVVKADALARDKPANRERREAPAVRCVQDLHRPPARGGAQRAATAAVGIQGAVENGVPGRTSRHPPCSVRVSGPSGSNRSAWRRCPEPGCPRVASRRWAGSSPDRRCRRRVRPRLPRAALRATPSHDGHVERGVVHRFDGVPQGLRVGRGCIDASRSGLGGRHRLCLRVTWVKPDHSQASHRCNFTHRHPREGARRSLTMIEPCRR